MILLVTRYIMFYFLKQTNKSYKSIYKKDFGNMERIFQYQITDKEQNQTISEFLKVKGYSRQNVVALKKMQESILVNGVWEYVNYRLKNQDILTIHIKEFEVNDKILPIPLPLPIVYEDEDILVIDKPSNMPIHPSIHNYDNTLANAVAYYYASQNIPFTFRCVNRLDKDTTGLTIIAKHMVASGILSEMVSKREIHREYLAIIEGHLSGEGTIDAPITREENSVIKRHVDFTNGERAVTHYKVLSHIEDKASLVSLKLETGRTHQIRVHMSHKGHPLLGDDLYGGNLDIIHRQALHSHKLVFQHPISKEEMCFISQLPNDMNSILHYTNF